MIDFLSHGCSRLAVTQRITNAETYHEPRDSLAQSWAHFLKAALPILPWMPIPNSEQTAVEQVTVWECDGLLLSGGETPGSAPLRDATETLLLNWAIEHKIPVLGVCRGMQMIQTHLGGRLASCSRDTHVAAQHDILWTQTSRAGTTSQVNSYHECAITEDIIHPDLQVLAISEDEDRCVEAFKHKKLPIYGIMWHPEREHTPKNLDIEIFRHVWSQAQ